EKSIVLLQNKNHTLPLAKDLPFVYLGGPFAGDIRSLIGNYHGLNDNMVTLVEGVMTKTSPSTRHQYRSGCLVADDNKNPMDWFSSQAKDADATIVGLGLTILLEGEEGEAIASAKKGDNTSMKLPEAQMKYLRKISAAKNRTGKKLIAVIFSGCPLDLTEVIDLADAVIYAWYPGQEGGQALANIIFGDTSPSGKLPISFPRSAEDLPPYEDYSMKGRTYKYMTKKPLYPFGFGLSYAKFEISEPIMDKRKMNAGESIKLTVPISNTGAINADEVIQLYISLLEADVTVPQSELKSFKRIPLQAGQSTLVNFELNESMFYYINEDGDTVSYKGKAKVHVGNASPCSRSKDLGASVQSIEIEVL
ncbi:MAG: glycoside hydrolase family 3 C-terminal domain-containing protein, partial [Planctomycetes bacterium]|nr:glycoside hydrolase family 3 C-terminal domain-containing protein [Planctomycetota bacterium]